MNSRERLLAAVNHRLPDRVPLDLWARAEIMADLREHLQVADDLEVRRATEQRIRTCGYDSGLILGPTNETQWDTPIENILAIYETAKVIDLSS